MLQKLRPRSPAWGTTVHFSVPAMRIEAKRQQSKSPHERGVRHPLGLMEPIVGALFEPRSGHTATHERPAEESRSIHDQLDEPHSPSDRLHHCLCTFCRWRFFVPMKCREEDRKKKKRKKKRESSSRTSENSSITATSILDRLDEPRSNCSHPLTWNVSFDGHSFSTQSNRITREYSQQRLLAIWILSVQRGCFVQTRGIHENPLLNNPGVIHTHAGPSIPG